MIALPQVHHAGFLDWSEGGVPWSAEGKRYTDLWCELTHSLLTGRLGKGSLAAVASYVRLSAVERAEADAEGRRLLLTIDGGHSVVLTAPDNESFSAWRSALQRTLAEHLLRNGVCASATPSPTRLELNSTLLAEPSSSSSSSSEHATSERDSSGLGLCRSSVDTSPPQHRSHPHPPASDSPHPRHYRHYRGRGRGHWSRQQQSLLAPPLLEDDGSVVVGPPSLDLPLASVQSAPVTAPVARQTAAPCLSPPAELLADSLFAEDRYTPIAAETVAAPRIQSLFPSPRRRPSSSVSPLADWHTRLPAQRQSSAMRLGCGADASLPFSSLAELVSPSADRGIGGDADRHSADRLSSTPSASSSGSRGRHRHRDRKAKQLDGPRRMDHGDPLLCLCQPRRFVKHDVRLGEHAGSPALGTPVYACLTLDGQHLVVVLADVFLRCLRKAGMLRRGDRGGDVRVALRSLRSARKFFKDRNCLAIPVANLRAVNVEERRPRRDVGEPDAFLCFLSRAHALILAATTADEATRLKEQWNQLLRRK